MPGGARSRLGSSSALGVITTRPTKNTAANALNAAPLARLSAGSRLACIAFAAHSSGVLVSYRHTIISPLRWMPHAYAKALSTSVALWCTSMSRFCTPLVTRSSVASSSCA